MYCVKLELTFCWFWVWEDMRYRSMHGVRGQGVQIYAWCWKTRGTDLCMVWDDKGY